MLLGAAVRVAQRPRFEEQHSRSSARSSPLVSLRNKVSVPLCTITPPRANAMLVGMLSSSAKTVNLSARPSPSVSSQMRMRSRPSSGFCSSFG